MKWYIRLTIAVIIVILVTLGICFWGIKWLSFLYTTVLALFPNEIKNLGKSILSWFRRGRQIRVSYAYLFRLQYKNLYLLVKDEQGRDEYHPVGGVYKYYPDAINIEETFEGSYDGLFEITPDTNDDLRLIIGNSKLKEFNKWFRSYQERETYKNLSREFKEELIETGILSKKIFDQITYKYVGSYTHKDKNEKLNIKQIHHFDIFSIRLTAQQQKEMDKLRERNDNRYIFASENNIEEGKTSFAGRVYYISKTSQHILIKNSKNLGKEISDGENITVKIS